MNGKTCSAPLLLVVTCVAASTTVGQTSDSISLRHAMPSFGTVRTVEEAESAYVATLRAVTGMPFPSTLFENMTDRAPDSLSHYGGSVLLVNFWSRSCPPCIAEMPALSALQDDYARGGFRVIFLAPNDRETLQRFFAIRPVSGITGRYTAGDLSPAVRTLSGFMPTSVLVDRDGVVHDAWSGAMEYATLERRINQLVPISAKRTAPWFSYSVNGAMVLAAVAGLVLRRRGGSHRRIDPSLMRGIVKRTLQVGVVFAMQAAILFAGAGRIGWMWAWIYLAISTVSVLVNSVLLLRSSPETVAERGESKFVRRWDKIIALLYSLFLFLLVPLTAALDQRMSWTGAIAGTWQIAGGVVLAFSYGISSWAMIVNAFFSTSVRIQSERGQTVCREGPYRLVRHPGYVGFILQALATAILLGSCWALIPGGAAAAVLIVRTSLEDRTLQSDLPGYQEYASQVRYRLFPGLW